MSRDPVIVSLLVVAGMVFGTVALRTARNQAGRRVSVTAGYLLAAWHAWVLIFGGWSLGRWPQAWLLCTALTAVLVQSAVVVVRGIVEAVPAPTPRHTAAPTPGRPGAMIRAISMIRQASFTTPAFLSRHTSQPRPAFPDRQSSDARPPFSHPTSRPPFQAGPAFLFRPALMGWPSSAAEPASEPASEPVSEPVSEPASESWSTAVVQPAALTLPASLIRPRPPVQPPAPTWETTGPPRGRHDPLTLAISDTAPRHRHTARHVAPRGRSAGHMNPSYAEPAHPNEPYAEPAHPNEPYAQPAHSNHFYAESAHGTVRQRAHGTPAHDVQRGRSERWPEPARPAHAAPLEQPSRPAHAARPAPSPHPDPSAQPPQGAYLKPARWVPPQRRSSSPLFTDDVAYSPWLDLDSVRQDANQP